MVVEEDEARVLQARVFPVLECRRTPPEEEEGEEEEEGDPPLPVPRPNLPLLPDRTSREGSKPERRRWGPHSLEDAEAARRRVVAATDLHRHLAEGVLDLSEHVVG